MRLILFFEIIAIEIIYAQKCITQALDFYAVSIGKTHIPKSGMQYSIDGKEDHFSNMLSSRIATLSYCKRSVSLDESLQILTKPTTYSLIDISQSRYTPLRKTQVLRRGGG